MNLDLSKAKWLNSPKTFSVSENSVELTTDPHTDFWQRTYYGFRNDNAPALLVEHSENFTFTVRAEFDYRKQYDQCGLAIYFDAENWFKVSIEYEDSVHARLGSVVTNRGHSDWATTDISPVSQVWYRLSRRGPDFLVEASFDGESFRQMRIFHFGVLGETTPAMGKCDPPLPSEKPVRFGLYACSPSDSSFTAKFDSFELQQCIWESAS